MDATGAATTEEEGDMDVVTRRTVEVEAPSLEDAMKQIEGQVGEGQRVITHTILADGKVHTARGGAESIDEAFEDAQKRVPAGAEEVDRTVATFPGVRYVEVVAFDEAAARTLAHGQLQRTEAVRTVEQTEPGAKGFLGLGKKPNRYRAEIRQQALVDISYRQQARVSAVIGEPGRTSAEVAKLDKAEAAGEPVELRCEQCGRGIRALPKPVSPDVVMVMTPEVAMIAARYCEKCNIIVCGRCVGVGSADSGLSVGGRKCPRCWEETEYAAIEHVRKTETRMAPML